jgi:eukaryotic-like serine/threonine-protein kinase
VAIKLEQSPFLNVLSRQKAAETMRLMGRDPNEHLSLELARDLCLRVGSKALVTGSIAKVGSQYVVSTVATNCASADSVASEQVRVEGKEQVLEAVDRSAASMRRKLGESIASIRKYDTPLEQATTHSLEALQAFTTARRIWDTKGTEATIPYYKRAIELDPAFARAYAGLGSMYNNIGLTDQASKNIQKAFDLRNRVSEREHLYIEARYYDIVTGQLENGIQTKELWRRQYPRDPSPAHDLAFDYAQVGRFEDALLQARAGFELEPSSELAHYNRCIRAIAANRLEEAAQAVGAIKDSESGLIPLYYLSFLRRDSAGMQEQLSTAANIPSMEPFLLSMDAETNAYHGRLRRAAVLLTQYKKSGLSVDVDSKTIQSASSSVLNAFYNVEFGYFERARGYAIEALTVSNDKRIRSLAALALARAGDLKRADSLASELAKEFPLDTMLNGYWLPTIRAAIELHKSKPQKALEELSGAARYELGQDPSLWSPLYPVYVRGQSYLVMGKGVEAAAEFHKYVDHQGVVLNCYLASLAHLGLARAYTLQGEMAKARTEYEQFLDSWKDADPDIPVLLQARTEYSKLRK